MKKYYQKYKKVFPKQLKRYRSALWLWKRLIHGTAFRFSSKGVWFPFNRNSVRLTM